MIQYDFTEVMANEQVEIKSARQRAKENYRKKTKQVGFELNTETDGDIIAKLEQVESKQAYIKELIRKDMMQDECYIVMDDTIGDLFTKEYTTLDKAIKEAEYQWGCLTDSDKAKRNAFYVIKSANGDPDAQDHFDGDIVHRLK